MNTHIHTEFVMQTFLKVVKYCHNHNKEGTMSKNQLAFLNQISKLLILSDEHPYFPKIGTPFKKCKYILDNQEEINISFQEMDMSLIQSIFTAEELRDFAHQDPVKTKRMIDKRLKELNIPKSKWKTLSTQTLTVTAALVTFGFLVYSTNGYLNYKTFEDAVTSVQSYITSGFGWFLAVPGATAVNTKIQQGLRDAEIAVKRRTHQIREAEISVKETERDIMDHNGPPPKYLFQKLYNQKKHEQDLGIKIVEARSKLLDEKDKRETTLSEKVNTLENSITKTKNFIKEIKFPPTEEMLTILNTQEKELNNLPSISNLRVKYEEDLDYKLKHVSEMTTENLQEEQDNIIQNNIKQFITRENVGKGKPANHLEQSNAIMDYDHLSNSKISVDINKVTDDITNSKRIISELKSEEHRIDRRIQRMMRMKSNTNIPLSEQHHQLIKLEEGSKTRKIAIHDEIRRNEENVHHLSNQLGNLENIRKSTNRHETRRHIESIRPNGNVRFQAGIQGDNIVPIKGNENTPGIDVYDNNRFENKSINEDFYSPLDLNQRGRGFTPVSNSNYNSGESLPHHNTRNIEEYNLMDGRHTHRYTGDLAEPIHHAVNGVELVDKHGDLMGTFNKKRDYPFSDGKHYFFSNGKLLDVNNLRDDVTVYRKDGTPSGFMRNGGVPVFDSNNKQVGNMKLDTELYGEDNKVNKAKRTRDMRKPGEYIKQHVQLYDMSNRVVDFESNKRDKDRDTNTIKKHWNPSYTEQKSKELKAEEDPSMLASFWSMFTG